MLTTLELLQPLAARRTDQIVVTTMSTVRPWGLMSDHDLDFASADSAMGHAADLALGIALAQPNRQVICFNGDGSMLMTLGTLATIVGSGVTNLMLVVVDNGGFEITGGQPLAGTKIDYAGIARACGFIETYSFDDPASYEATFDQLLAVEGPVFVHAKARPGTEGPISRTPKEPARYLRSSLADWSRILREALA